MPALYMNQNVFAIFEEFFVFDNKGKKRYKVTGMPLSLTKKLNIYDDQNNLVAWVEKPVVSIMKDTYDIYVHGKKKACIHEKLFKLFPWEKHQIEMVNWDVNGSILEHDYNMVKGLTQVASVHKKLMSFGDCYEIHVHKEEDELLALAVSVCLTAIEADHKIAKDTEKK